MSERALTAEEWRVVVRFADHRLGRGVPLSALPSWLFSVVRAYPLRAWGTVLLDDLLDWLLDHARPEEAAEAACAVLAFAVEAHEQSGMPEAGQAVVRLLFDERSQAAQRLMDAAVARRVP